jgi:hypothetical protein
LNVRGSARIETTSSPPRGTLDPAVLPVVDVVHVGGD